MKRYSNIFCHVFSRPHICTTLLVYLISIEAKRRNKLQPDISIPSLFLGIGKVAKDCRTIIIILWQHSFHMNIHIAWLILGAPTIHYAFFIPRKTRIKERIHVDGAVVSQLQWRLKSVVQFHCLSGSLAKKKC